MNAGQVLGLLWTIAAWWFIASVFAAAVMGIRKARARGKRLFADEPTQRVRALHQVTSNDHYWDS